MSRQSKAHKLLFISFLTALSIISLLISFTVGLALYRHLHLGGGRVPQAILQIVEKLAVLPSLIRLAAVEINYKITEIPTALLIPKDNLSHTEFVHKFPAIQDEGYLLLSGLSAREGQSIVQLIRIADGQVIAKWQPDWRYINLHITGHRFSPKGSTGNYRVTHPLLLSDASIIFNTDNSLVRLPNCSSKPDWILDYPYHHSIELSPEGTSVWVPSVTEAFEIENDILKGKLRDDSLSEVDLEGRILQNISFSKIISENNKTSQIFGSAGFNINIDPLHINQITPASDDSPYWKRGDLLISARNNSTVYLYRPKTRKIVWYQQGPWLNQHSVHFLNGNSIVIFGNNSFGTIKENFFIYQEKHNQIYIYDFKQKSTNLLHSDSLNRIKPRTFTEGRVRVLEDLSVFVEETNNARLFKLDSTGQLIWSYINTYDNNNLGIITWSRYITHKELVSTVETDKLNCSINSYK